MKNQKTKHFKAHSLIILALLIVLLTPVCVYAMDFDNVKFIKEISKGQTLTIGDKELPYNSLWEKYQPIEIKNIFGLGSTLMTGAITKHTETCAKDCSSEMQIYIANDGALIDDIKFLEKQDSGNWIEKNIQYQLYIQDGIEYYDVDDYETKCVIKEVLINGTEVKECSRVKTGTTHKETKPIWIEYELGIEVSAGTYNIRLEGVKDYYKAVDWQITTQGKLINEWAVWGAGGTITYDGDYVIHTFLTNGTFNVTTQGNISFIVVGGGGAGGGTTGGGGSGGGAGGFVNTTYNNNYLPAGNYTIIVGAGGTPTYQTNGKMGGNSTIRNSTTLLAVGYGGAGGVADPSIGLDGGSGSGGADGAGLAGGVSNQVAYPYTTAYGNSGGAGSGGGSAGGGGGARTVGSAGGVNGGAGGLGIGNNINGTLIYYAGGGGGSYTLGGAGGIGGGGDGSSSGADDGSNGTANTGGGGGGGGTATQIGYAGGSGIVIIRYENKLNVEVVLNSPIDNYLSTIKTITFNCSATTGSGTIQNISLWTNMSGTWVLNETEDFTGSGGLTNTSIFIKNVTDGTFDWGCKAYDTSGTSSWDSGVRENRTINIDTAFPSITINLPTTLLDYSYSGKNESLSWSITESNLASVWYNYRGINQTIYGAINSTTFVLGTFPFNLTLYANDSFGNTNLSYVEWSYVLFENSKTYSPSVLATSNESFGININYNSTNWISASAYLNYNKTDYLSTKTATTNNLIFNNSLIVPNPSVITNYPFYWNISLTNTTGTFYISTGITNQSVNPLQEINITSSNCEAGFSEAFNFTSSIEANLSAINFSSIAYNLQYGSSGNSSALVSYGIFSNIPSFSICINTTLSYWVGYGEIQYQVNGYSNRRFYIFQNTRLLNTTISNNLYSLETASSTPFQITTTNTALTPYNGYYIALLRWYTDLNQYKIVDMGKTDEQGQTVVNVKTNDVDYRLGLYTPAGVLIKLLEPIRMVCQTTPCVYSLIVDLEEVDLTTFLNIQSNLSYNPTTQIFTYIWNDPSQDTTLMNLTVWKDYADRDSTIICSNSATGFTGLLVCDVSGETGQLRAEVYRSASPPILIAQKWISLRDDLIDEVGGKTMVLFIGLILTLTMALMGLVSPPLVIILSLVSLIPLIFLGGISFGLFIIIGAVAGILLHFLRRIS